MKFKATQRIMRPAKFWIDGITYNITKDPQNAKNFKTTASEGKITTTFHIPSVYCDKIHTDPKFNLSKVKKSSSTEVLLPQKGNEGNVTITADCIEDVVECREEFHSMIHTIRANIPPRQFIAIPTLSNEVRDNFIKFRDGLLNTEPPIKDLDATIFQKPEKLHITVCVFALLDEIEINEAVKLLDDVRNTILMPLFTDKQVQIKLKGISSMDTNLKKTNVLYANASLLEESENFNLQVIGDKIAEFFYEKGFLKELRDSVKIHVTLINTKYRKTIASPRKRWAKRIPINATRIFEQYKDFDFGVCNLDTVHLSLMSQGRSEDGFYKPLSIATLT